MNYIGTTYLADHVQENGQFVESGPLIMCVTVKA